MLVVAVLLVGAGVALTQFVDLSSYLGKAGLPGVGGASIDVTHSFRDGLEGAPRRVTGAAATSLEGVSLSVDQTMVKSAFGRPPGFRIVFDAASNDTRGTRRLETWSFPKLGADFLFRNGVFADSLDVKRRFAMLRASTPRPEQFVSGMTYAQIKQLAGGDAVFQIDLPAGDEVLTAFHFEEGLIAGFSKKDGALRFIEQVAEGKR